ncbi:MAG: Hsp20/alpha crystallin family protein [bacterium]|nr:Hsp20/alpha crystallin family protein [bacterium]
MNMLVKNRLHNLPRFDFSNKDFNSLFNEFNSVLGDTFHHSNTKNFNPKFEVVENKENYEVHAELPGIELKDVNISLENSILTIKGEKKSLEEENKKNYHICERKYGSFERKFELPENIDEENIKAELKNGILSLTIAKNEKVEPQAKQIEINQG